MKRLRYMLRFANHRSRIEKREMIIPILHLCRLLLPLCLKGIFLKRRKTSENIITLEAILISSPASMLTKNITEMKSEHKIPRSCLIKDLGWSRSGKRPEKSRTRSAIIPNSGENENMHRMMAKTSRVSNYRVLATEKELKKVSPTYI